MFINVITAAVVLGVIVFVHELGHFLAAKSFGVRVETFSLGFGQRLVGFRRGGTDYRISALPFGGYVKMSGEQPGEGTGDPAEFQSKPRWQRFIVASAGPAMNVLLAVGLLIPVYMRHFVRDSVYTKPAVVADVLPNSPAAAAGLQSLDRIVRMDSVSDPTWGQVVERAALASQHPTRISVERDGRVIQTTITPRAVDNDGDSQRAATTFGSLGVTAVEPVVVIELAPGSPASASGLREGDRIVKVQGRDVLNGSDLVDIIKGSGGSPIRFTIERANPESRFDVTVKPTMANDGKQQRWMIGAGLGSDVEVTRLSFGPALQQSLRANATNSLLIFEVLRRLVTNPGLLKNLAGPVGMARATGDAWRQKEGRLLQEVMFTSLISLNLGIMNLLPIPVLDGGMILFLLVEAVMRREVSRQMKERIYQVGFAFLILLMVFVTYNDIVHSVGSLH